MANLEDKVQKINDTVVEIQTTQKLLKEQLKPTMMAFDNAIQEIIKLQNEQDRIKDIDFEKIVENKLREAYDETYVDKIKELIIEAVETKVKEIRWNDIKIIGTIIVTLIGLEFTGIGLIK